MIAPLAKFIDWSVLQPNSLHRPPFSGQDVGLEEVLKLVDGPDSIPSERRSHGLELELARAQALLEAEGFQPGKA